MHNPLAILAHRFDNGTLPRWLRRHITMTSSVDTKYWHLTLHYRFMGITFFRDQIR